MLTLNKKSQELDAGSYGKFKGPYARKTDIYIYILLEIIIPWANDILAKFSCILFRKSTFKTTVIILYGYGSPYYFLKL